METQQKQTWLEKFGLIFVFVLILLLILSFSKKGVYSSQLGINVAVMGDTGTGILLIRPQEGMLGWVNLPANLSVKIVNSGAIYPVSSLWGYGLSEKNTYKVVGESLSSTINVVIPRVVKVKGEASPENVLGQIHKLALQTDLSLRDRWLFRKDLVSYIVSKKTLELEIPKPALTKRVEPDGAEFLDANYVINLWTKNKFVFDSLLGENVNVKVVNQSNLKGAGLNFSKLLESSGLRVVEISSDTNEEHKGEKCIFKTESDNYPNTAYFLKNYLNCKDITPKKSLQKGEGIEIWLM